MGQPQQARAAFERAVSLSAANRDARFEKTIQPAPQQIEALLKRYPDKEKEIRNNLGLVYLKRGEYDSAEKEFRHAIAIDGNYDKAYYNLGLVFERRKDMAQARQYYEKAIELNPNHTKARAKLGR
jgi:Tfp pilus assembly protein PilF